MRVSAQARRNRRADLKTRRLKFHKRRLHVVFIGLRSGLLQSFSSPRHAPRTDPAGGAFEGVGRSGYGAGFRTRDTLQNEAVLARENLQDLVLEATVTKRHAPKVIFVKGRQLLLLVRQGQQARCSHGLLAAAFLDGATMRAERRKAGKSRFRKEIQAASFNAMGKEPLTTNRSIRLFRPAAPFRPAAKLSPERNALAPAARSRSRPAVGTVVGPRLAALLATE